MFQTHKHPHIFPVQSSLIKIPTCLPCQQFIISWQQRCRVFHHIMMILGWPNTLSRFSTIPRIMQTGSCDRQNVLSRTVEVATLWRMADQACVEMKASMSVVDKTIFSQKLFGHTVKNNTFSNFRARCPILDNRNLTMPQLHTQRSQDSSHHPQPICTRHYYSLQWISSHFMHGSWVGFKG